MVKENNVTSEQTFLVSIQVTDSAPSGTTIQPATFGQDYRLGQSGRTSETELFDAFQQRILFSSPYWLILSLKELKLFRPLYLLKIVESCQTEEWRVFQLP